MNIIFVNALQHVCISLFDNYNQSRETYYTFHMGENETSHNGEEREASSAIECGWSPGRGLELQVNYCVKAKMGDMMSWPFQEGKWIHALQTNKLFRPLPDSMPRPCRYANATMVRRVPGKFRPFSSRMCHVTCQLRKMIFFVQRILRGGCRASKRTSFNVYCSFSLANSWLFNKIA